MTRTDGPAGGFVAGPGLARPAASLVSDGGSTAPVGVSGAMREPRGARVPAGRGHGPRQRHARGHGRPGDSPRQGQAPGGPMGGRGEARRAACQRGFREHGGAASNAAMTRARGSSNPRSQAERAPCGPAPARYERPTSACSAPPGVPAEIPLARTHLPRLSGRCRSQHAARLAAVLQRLLGPPRRAYLPPLVPGPGRALRARRSALRRWRLRRPASRAGDSSSVTPHRHVMPVDGGFSGHVWYRTDRDITLKSYYLTTEGDADTLAKPDNDNVFNAQGQFPDSREPLVGEFEIKKRPFIVIGNHWNSKGGDGALYGATQPPVRSSEEQRKLQATYLRQYLDQIVFATDPKAAVVVAGDFNDFPFPEPGEGVDPLTILKGSGSTRLTNLIECMPARERYTFIFEGNSQVLDHLLVSKDLLDAIDDIDIAAFNANYGSLYEADLSTTASSSDHNPPVVWLKQSKIKKN